MASSKKSEEELPNDAVEMTQLPGTLGCDGEEEDLAQQCLNRPATGNTGGASNAASQDRPVTGTGSDRPISVTSSRSGKRGALLAVPKDRDDQAPPSTPEVMVSGTSDDPKSIDQEEAPKSTCWKIKHVADTDYFQFTTLAVICFNAVWIGIDTQWNHADPTHPLFFVMDQLFCVYFTVELVMRFIAFDVKCRCFRDGWFVFDSLLVTMMVVETWVLLVVMHFVGGGGGASALGNLSVLRLLRLLRLTRMARLMRYWPEMRTIVLSMKEVAKNVFFILCFLVICIYVAGIVFKGSIPNDIVEGEGPSEDFMTKFGSLTRCMLTLLCQGVLGDNMADAIGVIKAESNILLWVWFIFILISAFTIFNMLVGAICQVVSEEIEKEGTKSGDAEFKEKLLEAIEELDIGKDGMVSQHDWNAMTKSNGVRKSIEVLGVDPDEITEYSEKISRTLFRQTEAQIVEADANDAAGLTEQAMKKINPSIEIEELMQGLLHLRPTESASALDVETLRRNLKQHISDCWGKLQIFEERLEDSIEMIVQRMDEGPRSGRRSCGLDEAPVRPKGVLACPSKDTPKLSQPQLAEAPIELLLFTLATRASLSLPNTAAHNDSSQKHRLVTEANIVSSCTPPPLQSYAPDTGPASARSQRSDSLQSEPSKEDPGIARGEAITSYDAGHGAGDSGAVANDGGVAGAVAPAAEDPSAVGTPLHLASTPVETLESA